MKTSNELCKPVYYGISSKAIPTDTVGLCGGACCQWVLETRGEAVAWNGPGSHPVSVEGSLTKRWRAIIIMDNT